MTISLAFSGVIYQETVTELNRGFRRIELRHWAEDLGIPLPRFFPERIEDLPQGLRDVPFRYFLKDDFEEARRRVIFNLLLINGGIFLISALAGYFLAGKTLSPIENALEEQKRFIADASHELRTPLTALKTSMEVALRDKKMNLSQAKSLVKDNLEEINSMQSLTNELLSMARYQSNGHSLTFKEVDISEVLEKVVKKISSLAKEKEIEVKLEVGGGPFRRRLASIRRSGRRVEAGKLEGNEESLEEMLLIFLDNAVKYTPSGGKVTVETRSDKRWLEIKVKDTGIGIAKEDLPHIFDRFYRADQSRARSHLGEIGGFGLGLSLARKIIEIHKGTVEVASVLGKGTTFTIKLPTGHI